MQPRIFNQFLPEIGLVYIWAYKTYFYLLTNFTIHPISCYFIKGRFGFAHISFISWQTLHLLSFPSNKGGLENCKKLQKGVPGTFLFNKGEDDGLFHVDLGELGVFEPFQVGAVPPLPAKFFFNLFAIYLLSSTISYSQFLLFYIS